ncbi:MAG: hypothetical protein AAFY91_06920 [Bacteroidota bacterium]
MIYLSKDQLSNLSLKDARDYFEMAGRWLDRHTQRLVGEVQGLERRAFQAEDDQKAKYLQDLATGKREELTALTGIGNLCFAMMELSSKYHFTMLDQAEALEKHKFDREILQAFKQSHETDAITIELMAKLLLEGKALTPKLSEFIQGRNLVATKSNIS